MSKNLIPNSERTPEELREMTRNGGKKSGIARRQRKQMRDFIQEALQCTMTDKSGETHTVEEWGAIRIAQKYAKGDLKAAEFIARLLGAFEDKPAAAAGFVIQVSSAEMAAQIEKAVRG